MAERLRVAFLDGEPAQVAALDELLAPRRAAWDMRFLTDPAALLDDLDGCPVDAVVCGLRIPGTDGLAVLEEVARRCPEVVRIVLTGEADETLTGRVASTVHRILAKGCSERELADAIAGTLSIRDRLRLEGIRLSDAGLQELPAAPRIVLALQDVLADPDCSMRAIADVVRQDIALTARLLGLVNSAAVGLSRSVDDVDQAVGYLGAAAIEALTLQHAAAGLQSGIRDQGALEALDAHARLVARIARDLAERGDEQVAFAAGLLHDVGILVLAGIDPDGHRRRLATARETGVPLHVVELEERGASHAVTGGHLLELWKVPPVIVDAVALHHDPNADDAGDVVRAVARAERQAHALESARETSLYRHGDEGIAARDESAQDAWSQLTGA